MNPADVDCSRLMAQQNHWCWDYRRSSQISFPDAADGSYDDEVGKWKAKSSSQSTLFDLTRCSLIEVLKTVLSEQAHFLLEVPKYWNSKK